MQREDCIHPFDNGFVPEISKDPTLGASDATNLRDGLARRASRLGEAMSMRSTYDWAQPDSLRNGSLRRRGSARARFRLAARSVPITVASHRIKVMSLEQNSMTTTKLERAAIKLHRFRHDNLGHTTDQPVCMTGVEEALQSSASCYNLQGEIGRAGHRSAFFSYTAR